MELNIIKYEDGIKIKCINKEGFYLGDLIIKKVEYLNDTDFTHVLKLSLLKFENIELINISPEINDNFIKTVFPDSKINKKIDFKKDKIKISEIEITPDIIKSEFDYNKSKRKELYYAYSSSYKTHCLISYEIENNQLLNKKYVLTQDFMNTNNLKNIIKELNLEEGDNIKLISNTIKSQLTSGLVSKFETVLNTKIEKTESLFSEFQALVDYNELKESIIKKERLDLIEKMKEKNALTLFLDGGKRGNYQSSSIRIEYNNRIIEKTFIMDHSINEHEAIALLKGLEEINKMGLNNKNIYIVSDCDDNEIVFNHLISGNKDKIEKNNIKKLIDNVSKKLPLNNKFNYVRIKSHTNLTDYLFDGNRRVDYLVNEANKKIETIINKEDFLNGIENINANKFKLAKDDELEKAYLDSVKFLQENSKYKQIEQPKNIKVRNQSFFKSNSIYIMEAKLKDRTFLRASAYEKGNGYFKKDIELIDGVNKENTVFSLLNEILIRKDITADKLKVISDTEENKELLKKIITTNTEMLGISKLIDQNNIYVGNFNEENNLFLQQSKLGLYNSFKNDIKEKLGLRKQKKKVNTKKEDLHIFDIQKQIFDETKIYGNEDIFPHANELRKDTLYIFFNNDKKNTISLINDEMKEKIEYQNENIEDILLLVNNTLKTMNMNAAKFCSIITPNLEVLNEIEETFLKNKNLRCNALRGLGLKFKRGNIVMVSKDNLSKDFTQLDWYKKYYDENKLKLKIKAG